MDVDPRSGYDDLALAAEEAQFAGGLLLRQIACREPFVLAPMELSTRPGCAGDGCAAHQHFSVGAEFDFAPGEGFTDGSLGDVERMVQRDECGGLGHPVALYQHEAQRIPEVLE